MLPRISLFICILLVPFLSISQEKDLPPINPFNESLDSLMANDDFSQNTLYKIQHVYHQNYQAHPLQSLQILKKGLEMSFFLKDTANTCYFYTLIGNLYRDLGLPMKALEHHLQANKNAQIIGKKDMLAYVQNDIGNVYYDQGEYDKALKYYKKGINYSFDLEDRRPIAVSYNNIGLVHEKKGKLDSALYYHKLALKEREKVDSDFLKAHSYSYISEDYFNLGDKKQSEIYFEKATAIHEKNKNWQYLAETYQNRGTLLLETGEWLESIKYLSQALELFHLEEQVIRSIETNYLLAHTYIGLDDFEKALEVTKNALSTAEERNLLSKEIEGHNLLAKLYSERGDYQKAYEANRIYSQMKDTLRQEELSKKISILSFQSELDHLNEKLAQTKLSNELNEEKLAATELRNNVMLAVTIVAIVLVLLFVLLFYFKAKHTNRLSAKSEIIKEQKAKIEAQNAELRNSKELAESYSEAKTNFVSHVSHEIRTPMNAIIGLTQLLLEKGNLKDEDKRLVNSIRFSSKKLLNIINDVLDFSKIEAGKINFEEDDFNVRKLTDELITTFQSKNDKRIEINSYVSSDVPNFVRGDSTRLYQILNNLMGNAIKFTDDGYVRLNLVCKKRDNDEVRLKFEVEDTGKGMSREKMKEIFEAYNQGEVFTYKNYGGTGLGLTITKNLIELQGGEIKVESEEGEGSTFSFEIPYKPAETKMQVTRKSEDIENLSPTMEKDLHGMRILYVEDNEVNQFLAQQILKSWNVHLEFADDGEKALQKLSESNFDIILMDIQMPVMNGIEATQEIRKGNIMDALDVPIIGFTADVMSKTKLEAINAGMNDVMVKPFDKELLYEVIQSYAS